VTRYPTPVVLLVDDEPQILSALRRALRREGYSLLLAETTAEALRLVDEHPVDLVLTDHMMPGMSGLQLLERVAERRPDAVRMLITGWTEAIPPDAIERVGVRAVLDKPWEDAVLKQTLRDGVESAAAGF